MLHHHKIINRVSIELQELGWEIHPPISLIGPERPAISALKNGVRFDVTLFLKSERRKSQDILDIQVEYIQQNIHCLALLEFNEDYPYEFMLLPDYRTDYLKIYILRDNNEDFSVIDLMNYYKDEEFEFEDLIASSANQNYIKYFDQLEKSYDEYYEKRLFFRKYLISFGVLYTVVCEIISKLQISLIPKELNILLAPISPNIRFTLELDFVASFYSSIYLYMMFFLLFYIIKFKRIYHPIIGDKKEKWAVEKERAIYFIKGISCFCISQFLWPLLNIFSAFAACHLFMMYYFLMCFGTYADYAAAANFKDSLDNNYRRWSFNQ